MKILLTGKPGVGKSTLLKKVIEASRREFYGVLSEEIKDNSGNRIGFKALNMKGEEEVFAHKIDFANSEYKVGSYNVNKEAIDGFMTNSLRENPEDNAVLICDEIGRMEEFSDKFMDACREPFLDSKRDILGTIVFEDEQFAREFKKMNDVNLIQVTKENRDELLAELIKGFDI